MQTTVTLEHAKAHLEDLMAGAERNEEWLVVGGDGKPMGTLTVQPVKTATEAGPNTNHRWLFGMMKGQIEMAPDFDGPLEDFKEYME